MIQVATNATGMLRAQTHQHVVTTTLLTSRPDRCAAHVEVDQLIQSHSRRYALIQQGMLPITGAMDVFFIVLTRQNIAERLMMQISIPMLCAAIVEEVNKSQSGHLMSFESKPVVFKLPQSKHDAFDHKYLKIIDL